MGTGALNAIIVSVPHDALSFLETAAKRAGYPLDHWCSLLVMRTVVEDKEKAAAEPEQERVTPGTAKLTEDQAKQVIAMQGQVTAYALAEQMGVSHKTIQAIWGNRQWRNLPRPKAVREAKNSRRQRA